MQRTAVINVVGLSESLIGDHTPRISAFRQRGALAHIVPALPAVTCTAQSTYLTGTSPTAHGIVGNGWYSRELAEVQFWKQSNHLVGGRKLWEELRERDPKFTCAKLFWWYNMYSSADFSITPRPMYPADGRKIFDIYTWPCSIRPEIKRDLGEFPFATFWGPAAGVRTPQGNADAASRWIAASAKWIENKYQPTLSLIYLPHLDYNLQRIGPCLVSADVRRRQSNRETNAEQNAPPHVGAYKLNPAIVPDLRAIDTIVGDLIDFFAAQSVQVILLSEYGITQVNWPVHLNRPFRQQGWLAIRDELGLELLDCGASKVFAVADHQIAHIYINERSLETQVRALLEKQEGVEQVLAKPEKAKFGLDHPRAGDLLAVAAENAWFTYYYWQEDDLAPDFARTVDIHRKPGYDPVELFVDPSLRFPRLKIAARLLQKQLGFRMLMDIIPLDATLVKGSHGRRPTSVADFPVLISPEPGLLGASPIEATDVYHVLKRHMQC
jgi:predicted AlkP superfamily pyrophosphatase or phosphodiesterase